MARKRRFMTMAEFAREARISVRTVQRRIRSGDIAAVRASYHSVRIPVEELDRFPSAAAVPTAA